jgi:transcriptional regulator with XRE-family HTH domain
MARRRRPTDWEQQMSQRLQELRRARGMTQTELAAAADVSIDSLRKWETGKRTPMLDAAAKLAVALGVTVGVLAGSEPMPRKKK